MKASEWRLRRNEDEGWLYEAEMRKFIWAVRILTMKNGEWTQKIRNGRNGLAKKKKKTGDKKMSSEMQRTIKKYSRKQQHQRNVGVRQMEVMGRDTYS